MGLGLAVMPEREQMDRDQKEGWGRACHSRNRGCDVRCDCVDIGWKGTSEVGVKYVIRVLTPWRDKSLAELTLERMNGFQT